MIHGRTSIATLVVITIVTVAFALFSVYRVIIYRSDRANEFQELRTSLSYNADRLATGLTLPIWNFDHAQIDKVIDSIMRNENVYGVVVRLSDIQSTVHARSRDEQWRIKDDTGDFSTEGLLVEERGIDVPDERIGMVRIYATPKFVEARIKETTFHRSVAFIVLGLILTLILYLILWRLVLRPLQAVERYAAAVSSNKSSDVPLKEVRFRGEIEGLRSSIEKMFAELNARYAALQESEAHFRQLIKLSPIPTMIRNRNDDVEYLNDKFVECFGFSREEVPNLDTWWKLAYPDDGYRREVLASYAAAKISAAENGAHPPSREFKVTCKDGSFRTVEVSGATIGDNTLVIFKDISAYKRAEEARVESQNRLTLALEAAGIGEWELDLATNAYRRSLKHDEIYGYSNMNLEWNYAVFMQHVYPADREHVSRIVNECLAEGKDSYFECRIIRKDNALRWIWSRGRYFKDAAGKPSRILGMIADITERKQAEDQLEASLQEARALKAALDEHAIVSITDPNGKITFANDKFCAISKYSRKELLGQDHRIVNSGHHSKEFIRELWATIKAGSVWQREMKNKAKDGALYWVDTTIVPILNESGTLREYMSIRTDITERKRAEDMLVQAQKMEAVGQLAGGIAHDFNNLLTVIIGRSERLIQKFSEQEKLCDELNLIHRTGERAADLTRQLLAFSRRQILEPRIVDLNTLVKQMEKLLSRLVPENIEIRTVLSPSLSMVSVDVSQMEQVLLNLAVNARDAMESGGRMTIETRDVEFDDAWVQTRPEIAAGKYVMLALGDTGCGMDEQTRMHIFEPFFTTKGPGKGTGLGLATVYGIVKQSKGHITVESELRRGTVLRIYLPAMQGVAGNGPAQRPQRPAHGMETVLVAEDSEDVGNLAYEMLAAADYTVLLARNGKDALEQAARFSGTIDLLITDIVMPGMNGPELARKLSALKPGIKLMYTSGYTELPVGEDEIASRRVPFLQKPFTPWAFLAKVRQILDGAD